MELLVLENTFKVNIQLWATVGETIDIIETAKTTEISSQRTLNLWHVNYLQPTKESPVLERNHFLPLLHSKKNEPAQVLPSMAGLKVETGLTSPQSNKPENSSPPACAEREPEKKRKRVEIQLKNSKKPRTS